MSSSSVSNMMAFIKIPVLITFMIVTLQSCPCCYGGIVPELYLGIASPLSSSDGFAIATLEPTIKLSTKGTILNDWCDYSGGVTVRATGDSMKQELPFSVWGTIQKKSFLGWDWKARLDTESSNLNDVDFDVQAVGGPTNLLLRASGYLSSTTITSGIGKSKTSKKAITGQVQNVAFSQGLRLPWIGGTLSVSPAYNLLSKRTKVGVTYDVATNTQIILDANKDQQTLTVAHAINDSNTIVPSITSNGDVAMDYHYAVPNSDGGILSTRYRPNDSTTLEYKNGPWIASATMPMEGYYKLYNKPKFLIRRSLTVE